MIEDKLISKIVETMTAILFDILVVKASGGSETGYETVAQLQIIFRFNTQSIRKTHWMFNILVIIICYILNYDS